MAEEAATCERCLSEVHPEALALDPLPRATLVIRGHYSTLYRTTNACGSV